MSPRAASFIGGLGRTLIALGLIVLAFAAFQLWGTGWQEARAQGALNRDFSDRQAAIAALSSTPNTTTSETDPEEPPTPGTPTPSTMAPALVAELAEELLPELGESMGRIIIPSIDLDKGFVFGVRRDDLRKGPGHYPTTPLPGQAGNTAIAGHRTTYGSPFGDLDLIMPGDEIIVETLWGTFVYEVLPQIADDGSEVGHFIVGANAVEVVADQGDNRITLTACHPKYSAAQRIIVSARLVSSPAPELPPVTVTGPIEELADETDPTDLDEFAEGVGEPENLLDESLGWNTEEATPTLLWAAATALVAVAGWLLGLAWRRWPAYAVVSPLFLAALWGCFTHLDRLLPAL